MKAKFKTFFVLHKVFWIQSISI